MKANRMLFVLSAILLTASLALPARAGESVPLHVSLLLSNPGVRIPGPCGPDSIAFPNVGAGEIPHLGLTMVDIEFCYRSCGDLVCADAPATLTAANGDQLYLDIQPPPPGILTNPYVVTGGTGRFAGATGSGVWTWSINPNIPAPNITVTLDGTIDYKQK